MLGGGGGGVDGGFVFFELLNASKLNLFKIDLLITKK